MKTATEISSDNSALMRNVRKNENALEGGRSRTLRTPFSPVPVTTWARDFPRRAACP